MKIKNIPFQLPAEEQKFAEKNLDDRLEHTRGTISLVEKLLSNYPDLENVSLSLYKAALFHDCARGLSFKQQRSLAENFRGELDEIEKQNSALWHAPAGGQLLVEKLGYSTDNEVVQAVAHHTTGMPRPGPVLQGIIVADFTEKNREFEAASQLRNNFGKYSFQDITQKVIGEKIVVCISKNSKLHPRSIGAYNSLCD